MSKNGSDQARTATVVLAPLGDDPAGHPGTSIPDPAPPIGPAPAERSGRISDLGATRRGRAPTKRRLRSPRPSRPMTH